jgi:TRAP-type C4-dicarboxylate transport system substrate-binding protein
VNPRFATLATVLALLAACTPADQPPTVHIADSSAMVPTNPIFHWTEAVRADLERAGFRTQMFGSSTLGSDIEREEQTMLGLLQINISSGEDVMRYSDLLRTLRLPFLFDHAGQLRCLLKETDLLARANAETEPHGLTVLGIVFAGGMSGLFTTDVAVKTPADLAGLRIRALDRTQVLSLAAIGASPVKIPWEEIQAALQTGIASGYLNPPGIALQFSHDRDLRHFLALDVYPGFRFVTASTKWLRGLSPSERAALEDSVARASSANYIHVQAKQAEDLARLATKGVEVVRPDPGIRADFAARAAGAWDALADPDSVAQVRALVSRHCGEAA